MFWPPERTEHTWELCHTARRDHAARRRCREAREEGSVDAAIWGAVIPSLSPQARQEGVEAHVGTFPFAALGRAMALNETDGFVKVIARKETNEILGFQIVGPEAADLISESALALEMHAFLEDVGLTMHPHPTLGEGTMEATLHALGRAIHVVNRHA